MAEDPTRAEREAAVRSRAAFMRKRAAYSDHYGTWRAEKDAADAWEARELAAIAEEFATHIDIE